MNKLKRLLVVILALAIVFSVVACDGSEQNNVDGAKATSIEADFVQGDMVVFANTQLATLNRRLSVTLHYSDETSRELNVSEYTLTGSLAVGSSTVTVTYNEDKTLTDSFAVTVSDIEEASIKAVYARGSFIYTSQKLDDLKPDMTVTVYNNDGSLSRELADKDYTLSGEIKAGASTITVTYGEFSCTVDVQVVAVAPERLEIEYDPAGKDINVNMPLDDFKDCLTISVYNNDGSVAKEKLEKSEYTLEGTMAVGKCTITVKYGNVVGTFTANVAKAGLKSITAEYSQGKNIILVSDGVEKVKEGLKVKAFYNDGTSEEVDYYTIDGDFVPGEAKLTINLGAQKDEISVYVTDESIGIEGYDIAVANGAVIQNEKFGAVTDKQATVKGESAVFHDSGIFYEVLNGKYITKFTVRHNVFEAAQFIGEGVRDFNGDVDGTAFDGVVFESEAFQPRIAVNGDAWEQFQKFAKENGYTAMAVDVIVNQFKADGVASNNFVLSGLEATYGNGANTWAIADIASFEGLNFWSQSEGTTENYITFRLFKSYDSIELMLTGMTGVGYDGVGGFSEVTFTPLDTYQVGDQTYERCVKILFKAGNQPCGYIDMTGLETYAKENGYRSLKVTLVDVGSEVTKVNIGVGPGRHHNADITLTVGKNADVEFANQYIYNWIENKSCTENTWLVFSFSFNK